MTWKQILGFDGYEASEAGEIRQIGGSPLRTRLAAGGRYLAVRIDGRSHYVHTLVALAFHGPRPSGQVTRHRNGNSTDCRATNLTWGTQGDNVMDTVGHGRHNNARKLECPQGHPYDDENTRFSAGRRSCRRCDRERARQRRRG